MTIEQIQAYVNSKPDIRELINVIVDYMQNNPGTGGGDNIYTADGVLASDRTVNLNGKNLYFTTPEYPGGIILIQPDSTVYIGDNDTNVNGTVIKIVDSSGSIRYTASNGHTFIGKIINPDIVAKNFANDAAAATGGVAIGEDYHTAGVKKVRIA